MDRFHGMSSSLFLLLSIIHSFSLLLLRQSCECYFLLLLIRSALQECELDVSKESLEFSESYLDDVKKWCPELDVEESTQDESGRFVLVLSSPLEKYSLPGSTAGSSSIQGCAHVVSGFGRGSRELAVPTANLDPAEIPVVANLRYGVYCG